jgi:hypothetical protein
VSSFYPPIVPCAAGLLYFVFPIAPVTAQAVMLGFLALGLAATFALGRHLCDAETGLLAAFFLGTAPFVVYSLTNFQLDLPLMAMVAAALYALVRTEAFSHAGWCLVLGVALGLGMVTKPPFAGYVLPVFGWALWRALGAADRRRRLGWLRSHRHRHSHRAALVWPANPRPAPADLQPILQVRRAGSAGGAICPPSHPLHPRVLPSRSSLHGHGPFLWGIWTARRLRDSRAFLCLAAVVPFALFSADPEP